MIILDTCTAINCFKISKTWVVNLAKKCSSRTIIWENNLDLELQGLSKSKKQFIDYRDRLLKASNITLLDIEQDLSDDEYINYLTYLDQININDNKLLLTDLFSKNQKIDFSELQTNGKKRLSDVDKTLIALALTKDESILASDDNRILTLTEKYFNKQSFCCSAKIIEKSNDISCQKTLQTAFTKKNIYFYNSRYKKNHLTLC